MCFFFPLFFSKTTTTGAKMLCRTGENCWVANAFFGALSQVGSHLLARLAVLCLLDFFPSCLRCKKNKSPSLVNGVVFKENKMAQQTVSAVDDLQPRHPIIHLTRPWSPWRCVACDSLFLCKLLI